MNYIKKAGVMMMGVLMTAIIAGCGTVETGFSHDGRIPVVASFEATKEITEAIGGNKVEVLTVIPEGTEPHEFELKTGDIQKLQEARLFVYNGLGMEPWADQAIQAADNSKLKTVNLSSHITPIPLVDPEERKEHGAYDPHVWMGLSEAKAEALAVKNELQSVSPENREYFEHNYRQFAAETDALKKEYQQKFSHAPRKELVTGHAAFAYLCRDFGLTQVSVEDAFASGEPSAKRLVELADFCKAHHVKVVFTEELVSPAVSRTLAESAGASTESIDTLESSDDKSSYVERMRRNLEKILKAMQ